MMIVSAKDLHNPEVQREMRVRFPGLDVIHMDNDTMLCRPPEWGESYFPESFPFSPRRIFLKRKKGERRKRGRWGVPRGL
jgi:hypothetical protein